MNISGIRPYTGYSVYNNHITNYATDVTTDLATQEAESKVNVSADIAENDLTDARNRQTFTAYEYATQYDPDTRYDLKGEESDLRTLDVERAISDMQKDQVIHQYQFFVGENEGVTADGQSERAMVENFTL